MNQERSLKRSDGRNIHTHSFKVRNRVRFRICAPVVLALAGLAVLGHVFYSPRAGAQDVRARFEQDLGLVFMNHEEVRLDPRAIAERVKETGRMSLATRSQNFELQLRPNDLRAARYRAEEVDADGATREVPMPEVSTYKGNVEGVWASDARFTVHNDQIEGMIVTPTESYYVERADKYSIVAQPTDYVVYKASDVRPDITRTCGDTLEHQVNLNAKQLTANATTGQTPAVFSPFKVVEIATEADFEYTNALGGSAAANNDILSIMNQVQAIYERDIGLTFSVVLQHTWATPNDPYTTSGDVDAMLREFTNYWNANFSGTPRDIAHLFTARDLGGPAGVAWMGVVCSAPGVAYGLSDRETIAPFRVGIPAHEIGHNFNASHSDGQAGCSNTIMAAIQTQSNTLTFCQFSINEIAAYAGANSGCLSNAPAGNPIDDTDFFVRQHYQDFLGRAPDQAGLDFWKAQITNCGSNAGCIEERRIDVSASFFLSIEFQQTGYLVERTYKTAYGDADGTSTWQGTHSIKAPIARLSEFLTDTRNIANGVIVGQGNWEQTLENNKVSYFNQFVQTSSFINKYPANTLPSTYVQTLNQNAGSPLSASELATLIAEHTAGTKNRARVLRQIAEHPNLAAAEFNRAFVLMQYFGYLRRNPNDPPDGDYTGYDFWLLKLNQFNGNYAAAEMVKAFLSSTEYRRRFGTP